jgi:hypothetical protein
MNESIKEQQEKAIRLAELAELPVITFAQLQTVFDKWMLLPDRHIIKFLMSCYCANELSQRPVWAMIVAASGGGKTELLNSLLSLPKIYSISSLTPSTFLSGMPGPRDNSLLPKITGMMLVFKDWTVILSMQKDARAEIFGQFRDIHDGATTKEFGNGQNRKWKGKVSILAACTESIDINQQQNAHLGERFIYYRPVMPARLDVAFRALDNSALQDEMQKELQNAVYSFIKGVDFSQFDTLPELSDETKKELVHLTNFSTLARSSVIRDFGFKKEVIFVPAPEMPTRVLQQLSLLASGAMIVNGGNLLPEDLEMIYKTALDSIPRTNYIVIRELAKHDNQTTAAIAYSLGYPTDTIRTYLENITLVGVCDRLKTNGRGDQWTMKPEFVDIIRRYEEIQQLSEDQMKDREHAVMTTEEIDIEVQWDEMSGQIDERDGGAILPE